MEGDCSSEVMAAILGILYAMYNNERYNWMRFYDESTFKPISNKEMMIMMNQKGLLALLVGAMMVACVIPTIASDSDATVVTGQYEIYEYSEGVWTHGAGTGYNAYDAVKSYYVAKSMTVTADDSYTVVKENDWGEYTTINEGYGTITGIGSQLKGDKTWHSFVYVNGAWVDAEFGLAFYKCFEDYDADYRTANVALFYGTDSEKNSISMPSTPVGTTVPVRSIDENDAFKVTFYLSVDTSVPVSIVPDSCHTYEDYSRGFEIHGYGSDVALALKDAMTCNNYAIDLNVKNTYGFNTSYGYTTSIHGIDGVNIDDDGDGYYDHYYYWSSLIGIGNTTYSDFMFGFYTPISGAGMGSTFIQNEFTLYYTGY